MITFLRQRYFPTLPKAVTHKSDLRHSVQVVYLSLNGRGGVVESRAQSTQSNVTDYYRQPPTNTSPHSSGNSNKFYEPRHHCQRELFTAANISSISLSFVLTYKHLPVNICQYPFACFHASRGKARTRAESFSLQCELLGTKCPVGIQEPSL